MDKMWYYATGKSDRQGPISEAELRRLIAEGQINAADLAWTEGMADWTTLQSLPDLLGTGSAGGAASIVPAYAIPGKLLSWMGFVGVMTIVLGVFQCLTCFGIITGLFMIIAGVGLMGARTALASVTHVDPGLSVFFEKLSSFMSMSGVYYIISIVFMLIMFVIYFGVIATMLASFAGH